MNTNDPEPSQAAVITPGWPEMPETVANMDDARERWEEVCMTLDEMQVLSTVDRYTLEGYAVNYALWKRQLKLTMGTSLTNKPSAWSNFQKLAERNIKYEKALGLSVKDRKAHTRHVDPQEKDEKIVSIMSRLSSVG